tara:strand:+ start:121 stop:1044 length:924 start_codon:yes stop_codon:yes gene_type:complete
MPNQVARTGANLSAGVFVPQIYSAKLQDKFYAASTVPAIANHNWEGEIMAYGDTVNIRKVPTISIQDYSVNSAINYQDVSDEQIQLLINQAKYYAFKVDYIDDYQSDLALIDMITQDAAMQMAVKVDQTVLQGIWGSISTAQTIGQTGADAPAIGNATPIALADLTQAKLITPLLMAGEVLDGNNVPRDGKRWAVVTPEYARYLKQSDLKQVMITGDAESPLRNGFVGEIDGMKLYISTNLTNAVGSVQASPSKMFVGHESALTFASQFIKHEMMPLQNTFGYGIKGLQVFGFKVVKNESLVLINAY